MITYEPDPRIIAEAKEHEAMRNLLQRIIDNYREPLTFHTVLRFLEIEATVRKLERLVPVLHHAMIDAKALGL